MPQERPEAGQFQGPQHLESMNVLLRTLPLKQPHPHSGQSLPLGSKSRNLKRKNLIDPAGFSYSLQTHSYGRGWEQSSSLDYSIDWVAELLTVLGGSQSPGLNFEPHSPPRLTCGSSVQWQSRICHPQGQWLISPTILKQRFLRLLAPCIAGKGILHSRRSYLWALLAFKINSSCSSPYWDLGHWQTRTAKQLYKTIQWPELFLQKSQNYLPCLAQQPLKKFFLNYHTF